MKRITIVVTEDSTYRYLLVIDLETGDDILREKHWMFDDDYDEDAVIEAIRNRYKCPDAPIIYW